MTVQVNIFKFKKKKSLTIIYYKVDLRARVEVRRLYYNSSFTARENHLSPR